MAITLFESINSSDDESMTWQGAKGRLETLPEVGQDHREGLRAASSKHTESKDINHIYCKLVYDDVCAVCRLYMGYI